MKKRILPFKTRELFIITSVLLSCLFLLFTYAPVWFIDYKFHAIAGYLKQGTILTFDSTLRVPNGIIPADYCPKIINARYPTVKNLISYVEGEYQGVYCGCPPYTNRPKHIKYKLFKDKVIYQCGTYIYETILMPKLL